MGCNAAESKPPCPCRIDANNRLADLLRGEADLAIRYGAGRYRGLRADRLFGEEVFPVCAPVLREGPIPLGEPGDLKHHTLLHVDRKSQDETWPNWRMWLLAAGADDVDATRGPRFSLESMALQSTIAGHGVALGSSPIVADDLAAGRLVRPFALSLVNDFVYYVVAPETCADTPKIAAFRDWLLEETASGHGADD